MIPTERDKKLGCRIAALREARGITLIALAEKMGITVDALAGKERGERPFKLDELVLLTDAFHMSLEELVNETPVDYAIQRFARLSSLREVWR